MGVQLIISMDWEGTELNQSNLDAIKKFKRKWDAPIVHYYNPAYYTNKKFEGLSINKRVKPVLDSSDEIGLHLHTPMHFVRAAGVAPRLGPCFSHLGDFNSGEQKGQEVMLLAYSKDEIKKMLEYSIESFDSQGFKNIHSFRAGGWMSDERVWEALVETGFPIESSATNSHYLNGSSWEGDNLQRYISLIWGEMGIKTKPYYLQTFSGSIYEVPNNLGAIDYWKKEMVKDQVEQIIQESQNLQDSQDSQDSQEPESNEDLLLVINSHQETFEDNQEKLDMFLGELSEHFGPKNLEFLTNKDVYFKDLEKCS